MDKQVVMRHKEQLVAAIPEISNYLGTFRSVNKRWNSAITAGMIETGSMETHATRLFEPLIQDMRSTKTKYGEIQDQLMDAILCEMVKKIVFEITDSAKFVINIMKRNLFERTADVGYLAIDAEIVDFLKRDEHDDGRDAAFIRQRLSDYQYEYTVYNEIIILDVEGRVRANLDAGNQVTRSRDPLLAETQAVDLHDPAIPDKYIETFRPSDLLPGRGNVLIYSQKIEDPETQAPLGTLCLCFDFEDEMAGIFKDLGQGNAHMVLGILDSQGKIISSSVHGVLTPGDTVTVDLTSEFRFLSFGGTHYLVSTVETDGYQGFYGLTWYGLAMIDVRAAFQRAAEDEQLNNSMNHDLQDFSRELTSIKTRSEDLLEDMKLDSINGQIRAMEFHAKAFVEVLYFVKAIGEEIDSLFSSAIDNLQQTMVTSLFGDVQFRAFQGNNIADRNLYERANDVCWWALTPLFRRLLARYASGGLGADDQKALTENLQYINDLYTPYLRLALADPDGVVLATSNPPDDLEEVFAEEDLPKGQDFVGMPLDRELVARVLRLSSRRDYCVSDFECTPLYGGRPTYIYSTAVRDPEDDERAVGVIQIVFDAEPQFLAMLTDVLPRDSEKRIVDGCFGVFSDRDRHVISSTNQEYPAGSTLPLDNALFQHPNGSRKSTIVDLESRIYALGIQVSHGYREYKQGDGYLNDVVCMIFVPV